MQIDTRACNSPWWIPDLSRPVWCPCFGWAMIAAWERRHLSIVAHRPPITTWSA